MQSELYHRAPGAAKPLELVPDTEIVVGPGQWLSDVAPGLDALPSALILVAPMGLGKSWYCDLLAGAVERVLTVVPERALARGLCESRTSDYYKEAAPDSGRVVSTVHSLRKLDHGRDRWDLVVVEELPLVGDVLFSDTAERSGGGRSILSTLLRHMAGARRVLLQSADITGCEARAWCDALALAGIFDVQIIRARRAESNDARTIEVYRSQRFKDLWLSDVSDHQGGGPVLAMQTSAKEARLLAGEVSELRPDLRVLTITAEETATEEIATLLANPDRFTTGYDVLVFSPAVRTGVSITGPVRRVYLDGFRGPSGPSCASFLQSVGRFRSPDDSTVRATLATWGAGKHETAPELLDAVACSQIAARDALVRLDAVSWSIDSEPEARQPEGQLDRTLLDLWRVREAQARRESNNRAREFRRLAGDHGWRVVDRTGETPGAERVTEIKATRSAGKLAQGATLLAMCWGLSQGRPAGARGEGAESRARVLGAALGAMGVDLRQGGKIDPEAFAAWLETGDHLRRLKSALGTKEVRPERLAPAAVKALGGTSKRVGSSRDKVRPYRVDFGAAWRIVHSVETC